DPGPPDPAPDASLDDPLARAVRTLDDPRPVLEELSRQTFCPQIERQVHQPAVPIGGKKPQKLLHWPVLPPHTAVCAAAFIVQLFLHREGVVAPPALPPVPRPSPQGTPAALSSPLLRRLSSPSRAAPRSAWLQAAPAGGAGGVAQKVL